ncbi:hypothetical protein KFE25_003329 [Diacronema lutheri]|uniref:Ribosomal protein S13 n=1 Tax=Diacronema lutheri TaxID=2081491 RepID=A0A8J5XFP7_DIALT|nr:hypothetical protein KFE25_003329 [Diacronema lutheri]
MIGRLIRRGATLAAAARRAPLSSSAGPAPAPVLGNAEAFDPLAELAGVRRILKLPAATLKPARPASARGSAPVRLEGFSIPPQRGALRGLTTIFGVGKFQASRLCAKAYLSESLQVAQWTNADIERLTAALQQMSSDEANAAAPAYLRFEYGARLRRRYGDDIQKLKSAGTYRGQRHTRGLPLRGQRTKSNARTSRRRQRYDVTAQ